MRIARVRITRFRGYKDATFHFPGSTVLAGEPRAGRTDLVEALRRVLDARSTSGRVNPADVHRPLAGGDPGLTEVEVTLLDLGTDLAALLEEYLEAIDPDSGEPATAERAAAAQLGVRLCYRARYDLESDTGEHWVDCPALSDPPSELFRRVRRADREALPVLFVDAQAPLQVRAEGGFRRLLSDQDIAGLDAALQSLGTNVAGATATFSHSTLLAGVIQEILAAGPAMLLGLDDATSVDLVPEDGSLAALLRALQPAVALDEAGLLSLRQHGSTAVGVLTVAESIAAARRAGSELVVVCDDFGDGLDAPSAEHCALLLRAAAAQTIVTTRRPDVIRAFDHTELVRLTRSHGSRRQHRLADPDRAGRLTRSLVLDRLLEAITSRSIVLVEGPHDADGYGTLSARLARASRLEYSFAAHGMRLVSPPGSDGGVTRLAAMARVAIELGFHVRAILDRDTAGPLTPEVSELINEAEAVALLPERCAVEAALIRGVPPARVRETVELLQSTGELSALPVMPDEALGEYLIDKKLVKKPRLHQAWAGAVPVPPPIATEAIQLICSGATGQLDVTGVP